MKNLKLLNGYSKLEKKNLWFVGLMLLFPISQFLVFYVYINFSSFTLAFTNLKGQFSLVNFRDIIFEMKNPSLLNLQNSVIRSIVTWGVGTLIVFPVSILFTYALFKKVWGEMAFRVIFFLPGIIGGVVMATLYRYLLDGPISKIFYDFGWITSEAYQSGFFYGPDSFKTILIFGVWIGLGGNIIILTGALMRIPTSVLEYAKIDGVGFFKELFVIIIPLILPTLSTLMIFSLASIFTADSGTFLLTGLKNDDASTAGYYLFNYIYYLTLNASPAKAHYPAAVGFVLTVITLPVVLTIRHLIEKHTESIEY